MTVLEEAPPLLAVTKSQAGRKPGSVWREADRGAIVVVYGPQDGTACLVVPCSESALKALGYDPAAVRVLLDGTADDNLGPEAQD